MYYIGQWIFVRNMEERRWGMGSGETEMTHLKQAVKISVSNPAIIHTSDVIVSWDSQQHFNTYLNNGIQNPSDITAA